MAHLPPSGWAAVASTGDLDLLRAATKADIDRSAADLRTEVRTGMADLRAEIERSSRRTVLALVAVVATLNAGLLAGVAAVAA